jgi:DNA-directed RNA polymerase specialized sigma24 family protein
MDRAEAIERLPATHATVIRLLDGGADEQMIATRLDIHPSAVAPLVKVARAKLGRLLGVDGHGLGDGHRGAPDGG